MEDERVVREEEDDEKRLERYEGDWEDKHRNMH